MDQSKNLTVEERRQYYWRDIPADRILAALTPAQEPDAECRRIAYERILANCITTIPTPAQEPDAECRRWAYQRIPTNRILAVPTPDQEPDVDCRRTAYDRIPTDRITIPTPAEEPDSWCRRIAAIRTGSPHAGQGEYDWLIEGNTLHYGCESHTLAEWRDQLDDLCRLHHASDETRRELEGLLERMES